MAETTKKPTPVKIYITKDAIARGIRKARAVIIPQGLACLVDERGMALPNKGLAEPEDFTESFDVAQRLVQREVEERVAALKAEIARLEVLDLSTAVEG